MREKARTIDPVLKTLLTTLLTICCAGVLVSAAHADPNSKATPASSDKPVVVSTTGTLGIGALSPSVTTTPRLRYRVAVDQGKWEEIRSQYYSLPYNIREGIQALLIEKMQRTGYFQIMEREHIVQQQASEEESIDARKREAQMDGTAPGYNPPPETPDETTTAVVPPSAAPALPPKRAQRTPARYIVTPTVISFEVSDKGSNGIRIPFGGIRIGKKKETTTLKLSIRISDATTSAMLETAVAQGVSTSDNTNFQANISSIGIDNDEFHKSGVGSAIESALDDAVNKIVERLSKEPWSALVAAQDTATGRVIINMGSAAGITEGQIFDINQAGAVVLDPETGDVLSNGDETKIGRIRIVRVEANVAYGDVLEGENFKARNVVRLPR